VDRGHVLVGKKRPGAGGLKHVHEDEVLPRDQLARLRKTLRKHRVVERGEKNKKRALSQPQPDKGAQFLEIGHHALRVKRVKAITTSVIVRLPTLRANKAQDAIAERDKPELIALLFRRETEDQRRGNKP